MTFKEKNEKASIIIVTLGARLKELKACLSSVLSQTYPDFEVILLNDGPPESVTTIVRSFKNLKPKIKLINNSKRVGAAAAKNICLRHANGKYVFFIDDDAVAEENWLEKLVQAYKDPEVGGVGGTTIQYSSGRIKQRSKFTSVVDTAYEKIKGPAETLFLCGTNMSFKTDILRHAGGFDEYLGLVSFFEDTDVSLSVREKGYKLICEPAAVVVHYDIPYGGCTPDPAKTWYWFARNRLYVVLKHPKFFHSVITISAFAVNCFFKFFRRCNSDRPPCKRWLIGTIYITKGLIEAIILHLINRLLHQLRLVE